MDEIVHRVLRFDRFALDLTRGSLRSGDGDIELRPKAFRVLQHLVENAGRLVGKDELQKSVWGDIVVSDDSLVQCIRQLRRTLGDDEHRLIRTVSRRGYLLDAHVSDGAPTTGSGVGQSASGEHVRHQIETMEDHVCAGERKVVTVLYADISESLEHVARRDPEDALSVFETVLELMTAVIHRFEGTVSVVTGDGIFALFGVPLAHEDHAVRACHAALQMQQAVERHAAESQWRATTPLRVRIGLNSGEVAIRAIHNGRQFESRAMGPTMLVASRVGQRATPGTSLLGHATRQLVEGHVEVRPIAPADGGAPNEPVFELVGTGQARTRFQARMARGLTPFVGRKAELAQLNRAQALAARGRGQMAAIMGEAGVGKSRLVHEFAQARRREGWGVLESASVSYGKAMSYLPVIDLLKGYFGVVDGDSLRQVGEKVTAGLRKLDDALDPTGPALLALLDVPVDDTDWKALDAKRRRQRTLDAVKRLLLREAQRRPLLVIFEDLHWIDGETQALLDLLVDTLGTSRLLMLVTYRPEYSHTWGGKTFYSHLRLDALPVDEADKLLQTLVGDDQGLSSLKQMLVKRGNPFFLEETVRTLVETNALVSERGRYRLAQPLEVLQVPATVQAMLAARIDRLASEDKRLLQVAAVIGKDVPAALLGAIAGLPDEALRSGLERLRAAEFLYETALTADPGYTFKHALTHEVAYSAQLHERRRELHARIVGVIETLYPRRLDEQIERLAHHAMHGKLGEKAVHYLRQAGLRASARSAPHNACNWFEQALELIKSLPESRSTLELTFELHADLRSALTEVGQIHRALESLHAAQVLAERLDDVRRGRVLASMTLVYLLVGELEKALEAGTRGLAIARRLENPGLRIAISAHLTWAHYLRGNYDHGAALSIRNLATVPVNWTPPLPGYKIEWSGVWDRAWLLHSLAELGRFTEASAHATEAINIALASKHAHSVGLAYGSAGMVHLRRGDWQQALELIKQSVDVFRAGNVLVNLRNTVAFLALVVAQLGRNHEAADHVGESIKLIEALGAQGSSSNAGSAYNALGRTCLLLGRLDQARQYGDHAFKSSPMQFGFAAHAQHLLGDVASHPDRFDPEVGEAHYREALVLAEPRGMRPLVAHCHLGLAKLYQRTGKDEQARDHVVTATTMYGEMDMRFWLEQAGAEAHRLT